MDIHVFNYNTMNMRFLMSLKMLYMNLELNINPHLLHNPLSTNSPI